MFGEATLVLLGQGLAVVGMLMGVRLLTEFLDPATYGTFSLALTASTLLSMTIFGPIANAAVRFFGAATEQDRVGDYLAATRHLARKAALAACVALTGASLFTFVFGGWRWVGFVVLSFTYATLYGLGGILVAIQGAGRHRGVVALHQSLDAWLRVGVAVLLFLYVGASSETAMAGYAAASAALLIAQLFFFRRLFAVIPAATREGSRDWTARHWRYAWPFAAFGVFAWAQSVSDRWALEWFASRDDVGCLGVLVQFGYVPIHLATSAAVQYAEPILFQRAGDARDTKRNRGVLLVIARMTAVATTLTGLAWALAMLLHEHLFALLVADEYSSVSYLLPWAVLGGGVVSAAQTLSISLTAKLRTHALIAARVCTAVIGVALNLVAAKLHGLPGVIGAALVSAVLYFAWIVWIVQRDSSVD